jgi:putative endonuclease
MSVRRTIFAVDSLSHQQGDVASTCKYQPAILRSYVAVADEATARNLERYFKSGSGKAFAEKRFLQKTV